MDPRARARPGATVLGRAARGLAPPRPSGADDRTPTFAITHEALAPADAAARLAESGFAVWHGNYYAVEIMERLGLPDGAVRVGIVHYNTADEVDGLLTALREV